MAGTQRTLELTESCGYGDAGTRISPNGVVAEWLLANKLAVIVGPNEVESQGRPAVMTKKAIDKVKGAARRAFG